LVFFSTHNTAFFTCHPQGSPTGFRPRVVMNAWWCSHWGECKD